MKIFSIIWYYIKYLWCMLTLPHFKKKLKKILMRNETIICLFPHFGDIVYALAYAEQYKQETGKNICVYCSDNMQFFVKRYTFIDRIVTYKRGSLDDMYVKVFPAIRYLSIKPRREDIISTVVPPEMFRGLSALEAYKSYVFNIKGDRKSLYPKVIKQVTCIQNFERDKDKIVILNPYSFSMRTNFNLFEDIANFLLEKGYIVYTNCITRINQKPIKNTLVFDADVFDLYSVVNKIRMFISIRSGILDVLASSEGNLFAIYKNRPRLKTFFSLSELREDYKKTCDVYYKGKKDNKRIVEILNNFLEKIE